MMKKIFRLFVSLLLCAMILASFTVSAFADDATLTGIHDTYDLVHSTEFVRIFQATLCADGVTKQDVYYVVCRGLDFTETDLRQPRSIANAVKIGLSDGQNSYLEQLCEAVLNTVPEGEKLVFVGHSMGGMVIQQAIADPTLTERYEILYTMSIGSPYILTDHPKEGKLRRVVDKLDPVPFMSIPLLANPCIGEVSLETSHLALVHFRSYEKGQCWNRYDCLGVKDGNAYITLGECVYGA